MSKDHLTTIVPSELKIRHNDYFREGFQIKRVAKAFLKKKLPKRTLARLDLEGLTVENPHLTDEMYKEGLPMSSTASRSKEQREKSISIFSSSSSINQARIIRRFFSFGPMFSGFAFGNSWRHRRKTERNRVFACRR